MKTMRQRFGLTLMVNHVCNLRCTYCYTGAKFNSPMPTQVGVAAIDRAFHSLNPDGHLDVSFFGGEPLVESTRILHWMEFARSRAHATGRTVRFNLTTNGTLTLDIAWNVMLTPDLDLAISFDGQPDLHNRHRLDIHGRGTAAATEATLRTLVNQKRPIRVNFVVRPDTLEEVPAGLEYLYGLGVREVDLSLDLWTTWTARDGRALSLMIQNIVMLWRRWLPDFSLNWFDAKVGSLAQLPLTHEETRCGFGSGEIAVAPSGRLYPCERLIGEDRGDNPLQLPGHALAGEDFLNDETEDLKRCTACSGCALNDTCDTTCRCSNFIRTGDVSRPDGLLCLLNQTTTFAVKAALSECNKTFSPNHRNESTKLCPT